MILKIAILLTFVGFLIEGREIINLESKKTHVDGFWGKLLYGGRGTNDIKNDIKNVQSTTLNTLTGNQQKKTNINGALYAEPRQFHWGSELHHSTVKPIIAGSDLNMKVRPSGFKSKKNKVVEAAVVDKKIEKKKNAVENQDLMFKLTSISKNGTTKKKINKGSEFTAVVA